MNKTFRKIALIFSILFSINILIGFFMGFDVFLKSAKESWDRPSYNVADTTYQYQEKIDHYTYLLDSLLEVNPKQAELFAEKLHKKYIEERVFTKYKVIALVYQEKYEEAIVKFKRLNKSKFYSDYNEISYDIGICYENLKQYDSAIHYYKNAGVQQNLTRIYWCFEKSHNIDSSIFYLEKIKKNLKNDSNILNNIKEIDFIERKLDSLKKALN